MMMTRTTHTGEPLTYAAIGASQAPDLLYYPPKGYRPAEDRMRLGSGAERFQTAAATLLSWGVQRGSGIQVQNIELPVPSETDYIGLVYDEAGDPIAPREPSSDQTYSEDGTPQVVSGLTAELSIPAFGRRFIAPIRVVLVIDEPTKAGFAYGTLRGHPEEGEESFVVTHEPDDSVWLTVRSFSRASSWQYRLATPALRSVQRSMTKRYLRSLLPGRTQ
jgi:uncharacterized protein (UPF0548 family)